jgi:glucose/arabinose dehydrogenase
MGRAAALTVAVVSMGALAAGCYDSDNGARGENTSADTAPVVDEASSTTLVEDGPDAAAPDLEAVDVQLTEVAQLDVPIAMATREGTGNLYVAERVGRVQVLMPGDGGFATATEPLLDISDDVVTDGERGLLGLTFSPDGEHLYLSFSNRDGDSRVTEYEMDGDAVVEESRRELIALDDPYSNHNGGQISFGPDGFLYVAFGDGGLGGDPLRAGQDPEQLFGKILRIDPSGGGGDGAYGIPADNPYADGDGGRPEVYLYGVRNPWRFSFDWTTGDLWIGDVGQGLYEEIDYLPAADGAGLGANLGWNQMEGLHTYEGGTEPDNHTPPIFEYDRDNGECSVTGGYVYRGEAIPELRGAYVYGDYCLSEIQGLVQEDGEVVQQAPLGIASDPGTLISFGQDADGELYVLASSGQVSRIDPA